MSPRILIACTASLVCVALAEPAEACTPPPPGFAASMPRQGDIAPANTVWFVQGHDVDPVSGLWLDFDVFLPLTVERVHGIYELRNDFGPYNGFAGADLTAESGNASIAPHFTNLQIADVVDQQPPRLVETYDISFQFLPEEPGLCQPGGYHVAVTMPPAFDDFGIGTYVLWEVSGDNRIQKDARLGHISEQGTRPIVLRALEGTRGGRRCYVVDATDFAGNTTRGTETKCVDLTASTVDAGVLDGGSLRRDAGAVIDAGDDGPSGLDLTNGRGCACSAQHRSGGVTGLFVLLVGLGLSRRRVTAR